MSIPEVESRNRLLNFLKNYLVLDPVTFSAIATSTQTISRTTHTTVQFDTETFAGIGYDTSTDTFTAPYDGKYHFHANVLWLDMAADLTGIVLYFKHNTTRYPVSTDQYFNTIATNGDITQQGSIMLDLIKGDTVIVQVYYTGAGTTEQLYGDYVDDPRYTQFFGYRV